MRILVVDDEPLIASTIGLIFRKHGYETETMLSTDSAMAALRLNPPDLVLCDIDMPGRDGIALMLDVGRELPTCPILVLTGAYATLTQVHDCARKLPQSVSIVTKPCPPQQLLNTAHTMLNTPRAA